MRFLPGNAQHIGARHSQQDSFGFNDPDDAAFIQHGGFLAIVCDGMGGMEHGDLAGRTGVRAFLEAYARKTAQESVPAALDRSVREANARVVALAHSLGRAESIGTTLVAAALLDGGPGQARLYWVSVGDSGLFHVSDGQIQTVNRPHIFGNLLDNAVARGSMSKEQALLHPERESLTSFIGVEVLEEIDRNVDPWPISDGDSILLASDGLFKTLSPEEILESLNGHPQAWPDALVARTLAKKYEFQDNVTVLSVAVQDQPDTLKLPPPAVAVEREVKPEITVMLPPRQKRSRKLVAAGLIVLAGIAAGGGGRWWYKKHHPAPVTEKK
jgi:PPM family protein phosphatase